MFAELFQDTQMRNLFNEYLKSKGKTPEPSIDVASDKRKRTVPDEVFSTRDNKKSGTLKRSGRSFISPERVIKRKLGSLERRRRRSGSRVRTIPKYLYMVDMPEELLTALRVRYFYFL